MNSNNSSGKLIKGPGRPPGSPNKITRDIRVALRDLAEGNANSVQDWLNEVAKKNPAEAVRLWLDLLKYVVPTLTAAAFANVTPLKETPEDRLVNMTDEELLEALVNSPTAAKIARDGAKSMDELLLRIATPKALPVPEAQLPECASDDELLS